ncbi:MAG: ThiF family adenylyltransferase [Deltaproteobacteria bacterium]|nr:ThiF family adenylyltransferase [Deltaproteobacteria bacterium]
MPNKNIHIVGCGGLGHAALMAIVSGFDAAFPLCITLIDGDRVELSNLNRQVFFTEHDLGRSKPTATEENIHVLFCDIAERKISIACVETNVHAENISALLKNSNYVIDATDSVDTKFLINDFCTLYKIPFCYAGASGTHGQLMHVNPLSSKFACLRCLFGNESAIQCDGLNATCRESGILGAVVGHIGLLQGTAAVEHISEKIITEAHPCLLRFALEEPQIKYSRVEPSNQCPNGCGTRPQKLLNLSEEKCPMTFLHTKIALENMDFESRLNVILNSHDTCMSVGHSCREEGYDIVEMREIFSSGSWLLRLEKGSLRTRD